MQYLLSHEDSPNFLVQPRKFQLLKKGKFPRPFKGRLQSHFPLLFQLPV